MDLGKDHIKPYTYVYCSFCKAENKIFQAKPVHYECQSCRAVFTFNIYKNSFDFFKLNKAAYQHKLPMYAEGVLNGKTYKVIGSAYLKEQKQNNYWTEYYLIDSNREIKTLSNYNDEWIFVKKCTSLSIFPKKVNNDLFISGVTYQKYNAYYPKVIDLIGEQPQNVLERTDLYTREFVANERMFIYELNIEADKGSWYEAEYMSPQTLKNAFNLPKLVTDKDYKNPLFPSKLPSLSTYFYFILFLAALVTVFQLYFINQCTSKTVYENSYNTVEFNKAIKTIVTKPFQISKSSFGTNNNLEFDILTNIDNNWIELYCTLLNEQTGEEITLYDELEYYHGYTGGENWSEGANYSKKIVTEVPAGTYRLIIQPNADYKIVSVSDFISDSLTYYEDSQYALANNPKDKYYVVKEDTSYYVKGNEEKVNRYFDVLDQMKTDTLLKQENEKLLNSNVNFNIVLRENNQIWLNYVMIMLFLGALLGIHYIRCQNEYENKWS